MHAAMKEHLYSILNVDLILFVVIIACKQKETTTEETTTAATPKRIDKIIDEKDRIW